MPIRIGDTARFKNSPLKMLVLYIIEDEAICQIDVQALLKLCGKEKEYEGKKFKKIVASLFPVELLNKVEGENQ